MSSKIKTKATTITGVKDFIHKCSRTAMNQKFTQNTETEFYKECKKFKEKYVLNTERTTEGLEKDKMRMKDMMCMQSARVC